MSIEKAKSIRAWEIQLAGSRWQQAAGLSVISYSLFGRLAAMSCLDVLNDFLDFYAFYDFYDFYHLPFTIYCLPLTTGYWIF
jgi:hypothetical protein